MKKKKEEKQSNLYGDEDKVFNVLETDIVTITSEIKGKHDKIEKLKKEIKALGSWMDEVVEARDIVAKTRKTAEPDK